MSLNHQELPPENIEQSPGCDPKASKRNSGLFAFLKWFKPSTSRESIDGDVQNSHSSSCDSLNSTHSNGTVASFSYVPPSAYGNRVLSEKCIVPGPETDTYKARLKQRDKRRENDKNVTLRKKYNLFFNRETLLKTVIKQQEENTKSLPLMTKTMEIEEEKVHRRTNSESSKTRKAGAYLHVKGKRRAPQPPGCNKNSDASSTSSLRRKKRLAPPPPAVTVTTQKIITTFKQTNKYDTIEYADADIICNDSLKLDHGILKPAKETDVLKTPINKDQNSSSNAANSPNASARSSYVEAPVSPRPWYKRNTNTNKKEHKYEQIERLPEVQYMRNSTLDLTLEDGNKYDIKKKDEKRKSGLSFLTNISELDREASEIIKKEHQKNGNEILQEIPEFMRPKETDSNKANMDSLVSPRRKSARDLIAKFNAITNVTKVTVNSAFFGNSQKDNAKRDFFGKQHSLDENKRQESLLESHKMKIDQIDKKIKDDNRINPSPLMKSESASAIKSNNKPETPKVERKSWNCPKCFNENDYWRIICHVCSTIKPYFDDFSVPLSKTNDVKLTKNEIIKTQSPNLEIRKKLPHQTSNNPDKILERSKTQIGFSALASYNNTNKTKMMEKSFSTEEKPSNNSTQPHKDADSKREEKEKLKKMLIEMKNSLPKRKSNILMKQNSRASIIVENPSESENKDKNISQKSVTKAGENSEPVKTPEKSQEQKVAEILIGTTQTIYENIKVRKNENPKPIKISTSVQTSAVPTKVVPASTISNIINKAIPEDKSKNNIYEPMKVKDFEDIYGDKNSKSAARVYANLAQNDELSLFFNMPKRFQEIKNNIELGGASSNNTDTIEINRLLRRLESAIAKGEMTEAAIFAKELAQLKVNCSVTRQKPLNQMKKEGFKIEMYVEDKVSHRGPFSIHVTEKQTVGDLKTQIEKEFEIPTKVQRWILGKELATNDKATLKDHRITAGCPVFLYLVTPDPKIEQKTIPGVVENKITPSSSKIATKVEQQVEKNKTEDTEKNPKQPIKNDSTTNIMAKVANANNLLNESIKQQQLDKEQAILRMRQINFPSYVPKPEIQPTRKDEDLVTNANNLPNEGVKQQQLDKEQAILRTRQNNFPSYVPKPDMQQTKKDEDHTPKIVKVIPKSEAKKSDNNPIPPDNNVVTKTEFVKCTSSEKTEPVLMKPKTTSTTSTELKASANEHKKMLVIAIQQKQPTVVNPITTNDIKSPTSIDDKTLPIRDSKNFSKDKPVLNKQKSSEVSSVENRIASTTEIKILEETKPKTVIIPVTVQGAVPKTKPEEDVAQTEWECHLCTLLNSVTSNVCAVCATVRLKQLPKKQVKKKAPQPTTAETKPENNNTPQTYQQLMNLDNAVDLVENSEPFECVICFLEVPPKEGVTLRECLHQFCKVCLSHTIEYTDDAEVKCPYRDDDYSCNIALQDREIKALLTPALYEAHLAKSVAQAENRMDKSFHCKTPDCKGWCIFEDNVNDFRCPVCRRVNCLTCQAIHMGLNCKQYQERMNAESENDDDAKRTKQMLDEMVAKGEALTCPTCQVIMMKKWGCDWLRCSMCKTEICWVTRGPRWGPGGKGDTSGGCKCGVNGVKCHPQCNYCH